MINKTRRGSLPGAAIAPRNIVWHRRSPRRVLLDLFGHFGTDRPRRVN